MAEQDPAFDECGEICGSTGEMLQGFCDGCQVKEAEDAFEADCLEWLEIRVPDGSWKVYGLPRILATVLETTKTESLPLDDQSAKCGRLISLLNGERNRKLRIDAWNRKKAKK